MKAAPGAAFSIFRIACLAWELAAPGMRKKPERERKKKKEKEKGQSRN
jgi:hypothetical protein